MDKPPQSSQSAPLPPPGSGPPPKARLYLWPISIIAFFVTAILGCISFVAFCSLHPTDLVAPDYYEQEIRYQKQIERLQRARDAGPLASITHDPARGKITVSLPPATLSSEISGEIHLYRPSAAKLDRLIKIDLGPSGTQELDAASLRPGLWKIRVLWSSGDQEYYLERQLTIRGVPPSTSAVRSQRNRVISAREEPWTPYITLCRAFKNILV